MPRHALIWLFCLAMVPAVVGFNATTLCAAEEGPEGTAATHDAAADPHAEDAHGGGDDIFAGGWMTVILTLAIFIVLLAVLGKWAWGPILSGLQKREEYIRQSIEDAEKARDEAEKSMAEYKDQLTLAQNEAQAIIEKGRRDAAAVAEEMNQKAQAEAQGLREQAHRDINSAKDQALRDIYQQTTELATDLAAKIIGKSLDPEDHRELLKESLNKLQGQEEE